MSEHATFAIEHDIFVPRDVVYTLWTDPTHLEQWLPALLNAELISSAPPEQFTYRLPLAGNAHEHVEIRMKLQDIAATTHMEVEQTGPGEHFPADQAAWQRIFVSLENYLSDI